MATATSSDFSKKRHFLDAKPTSSTVQQIPSKSNSNWLCKSLIVILILIVIPLFPSKAPDFITQTILTDIWEIIHLLFIGIAVSYGLFSTKSGQIGTGTVQLHSRNDGPREYLSEILHVPPIFEDGFENLSGFEEKSYHYLQTDGNLFGKRIYPFAGSKRIGSFASENGSEGRGRRMDQAWNSRYYKGESIVVVATENHYVDERIDYKPLNLPVRSLRSRIVCDDLKSELLDGRETTPVIEDSFKSSGKIQKRAMRGMVPMDLENKFQEDAETPSIPWRSRLERIETREPMSSLKSSSHFRPHSVDEFEFDRLRGFASASSPEGASSKVEYVETNGENMQPWRSRSERMDAREEIGNNEHPRSHSIEESEFRHPRSMSRRGSAPDSSPKLSSSKVEDVDRKGKQPWSWRSRSERRETNEEIDEHEHIPHSRHNYCGEFEFKQFKSKSFRDSASAAAPQVPSSEVGNVRSKKDTRSSNYVSQPKEVSLNTEASSFGTKTRPFSLGSSLEMNALRNLENGMRGHANPEKIDSVENGKQPNCSLDSDERSSTLAKILSQAKSVRTNRQSRYPVGEEKIKHDSERIVSDSKRMCNEFEEIDTLMKNGRTIRSDKPNVNSEYKDFASRFSMPKPKSTFTELVNGEKFTELSNGEKQHSEGSSSAESNEGSGTELGSSDENSSRTKIDNKAELDNDTELEGSEVDRKAGEFIAKFREQIRLQKIASARRYSGR